MLGLVTTILLALLVAAFATSLLFGAGAGEGLGGRLLGLVWGLLGELPVVFSLVVLIFAGLQRLEVRPDRGSRAWDPRRPEVRDRNGLASVLAEQLLEIGKGLHRLPFEACIHDAIHITRRST